MASNKIKYKMEVGSGCGRFTDGGVWIKKETDKTITFIQEVPSFFQPNWTKISVKKFYKDGKSAGRQFDYYFSWMNNGHVIRDFQDGEYTIYPEQCGIPHVLTPIK